MNKHPYLQKFAFSEILPDQFGHFIGLENEIPENITTCLPADTILSKRMIELDQVHSKIILKVDNGNLEKNFLNMHGDGLITSLKNIILAIKTADCVPVILAHRTGGCLAVLHCGWRGTRAGIIENCATIIESDYCLSPKDFIAVMGPSILGDEYQVGGEVASQFPLSNKHQYGEKYLLDLPAEISMRLISLGVKKENISLPPFSTLKNEWLPSYRRDGLESGRLFTACWIK